MKSYRCRQYRNDSLENDIVPVQINEESNINSEIRQSCNMNNNQNHNNDFSCGFDMDSNSVFPNDLMYGQSYVPIQTMNKVFNPETGLKMGTIYPELVSPYLPCQSIRTIEFLKNSNDFREGIN